MLTSPREMVWADPGAPRVDAPMQPQPAASVQTALLPTTRRSCAGTSVTHQQFDSVLKVMLFGKELLLRTAAHHSPCSVRGSEFMS